MTNAERIQIEKTILCKVVDDALAAGYSVTVYDCEEFTIKRSRDREAILKATMTTDDDRLYFYPPEGGRTIGWVWFVYGENGHDVICDYIDSPKMEALLSGALALADKLGKEIAP